MMVTSHAVVGVAVTTPILVVAPDLAPVAALAGFAGGVAPDLDLLVGTHRKTLHFPLLAWVVAVPAVAVAAVVPSPATVAVAAFLVAGAVHAGMDAFGAGEEMRPWERTSTEAVYLHPAGRWLRARYWVPYDGSARDLGLTLVGALPGLLLFSGLVRLLCATAVAVAVPYTLVRKRLPPYFERIV
ncbi:metal-dependent hydrolase [Salinigranum sp. GCM10025319]|uniref:metal-dependent hydrolase n=1 Tax=Salinigranum sp. GCM10025319 TaxID=3252687 RepID=UPI00360CC5DC